MRSYKQALAPPFWARGGHGQTILGHVLPSPGRRIGSEVGDRRIEVEVTEGDRLIGFECRPTGPPTGVRVHLFHGLSGDVNAEYMRRTAEVMTRTGFEVWTFNHRGAGAGAGLAQGIYHSGRSDDISAVLAASRLDSPGQLQLVIGFSLSGNASIKLAAEIAAQPVPVPDGIIAVNPPMDLLSTSHQIHTGFNRLYEARFVRRLRRTLSERKNVARIPRNASLFDIDELVTAPLGGFKNARDYYACCSTIHRLESICIPTVIITTEDDPFVDAERIANAPRNRAVHLHIEPVGGHVGYLAASGRLGLRPTRWLDGALGFYAHELIREIKHTGDGAPSAARTGAPTTR